jgi:hypothetical protein
VRVLAFLLAVIILLLLSLAIKVEVNFRYKRIEKKDYTEIDIRAFRGLWHIQFQIPSFQLEWEEGPQIEVEQVPKTKVAPRQEKKTLRMRYLRVEWLYRFWPQVPFLLRRINQIKRQLYRGIRCKAINWRIEIGLKDAADTAIAAGSFWTMIGFTLSNLYRKVTVEVRCPELAVIPQFEKQGFLCDFQCIFQSRIGHIIFVGINVLRTIRRGQRG